MKLEDIGFYTLSDERVRNASGTSPMQRGELILTDACNFKCPYCRGVRADCKGTIEYGKAIEILKYWFGENIQNIRFSGGEPTLYPYLPELVRNCVANGVKRIAVSTNGSADRSVYKYLLKAGVNDFSVSLGACCASEGEKMMGVTGKWEKVIENIRWLSKKTYTTVGVVVTSENLSCFKDTIAFASSLGVSDIRVISSAQFNGNILSGREVSDDILSKHPILKYRYNNAIAGKPMRGIKKDNFNRCPLVMDDMAIAGEYHFPCIIYFREQGDPIGKVGPNMRRERVEWWKKHDTYKDKICKGNCLDVCIDYNERYAYYNF